MNISFVCGEDLGNTAERISQAVAKYTRHTVRYVDRRQPRAAYIRAISRADVIWLGGDGPIERRNNIFKLYDFRAKAILPAASNIKMKPGVKIIHTTFGSFFRRPMKNFSKSYGCVPLARFIQNSDLIAPITPDLNYPELKGLYFPHANDTDEMVNVWKPRNTIVIGAYAAQNDCKNVKSMLLPAVKIARDRGCKIEVRIGGIVPPRANLMPHDEFMQLIGGCTVYYDQITPLGIYAYAGVEAMSMGVPVIAGISETAKKQATPIENYGQPCMRAYDVESLAELITDICRNKIDLQGVSAQSRDYAVAVHSYQSVASRAQEYIDRIL